MNSFLKEIEKKFLDLESTERCESCDQPKDECKCEEELDEMSTTGAVAGYNTPAAFSAPGKWKNKKLKYESVTKPPTYTYKDERYQKPESDQEEYMDKFPFADDEGKWQHRTYDYPSKPIAKSTKTTNDPADKPMKFEVEYDWSGVKKNRVAEALDGKYEQLIESYRKFATNDAKTTPEQKVKRTIQEVAKRLREIEQLVEYNSKLKKESNIAASGYGSKTQKALTEISNRLIKISERVRSLGE
jgi:hypothetical protein